MMSDHYKRVRRIEFGRAKLAKIDLDRKRSLVDPSSFHTLLLNAGFPKDEQMDVSDRVHKHVSSNLYAMKIPCEAKKTVVTEGLMVSRSHSDVELKRLAITQSKSLKSLSRGMIMAAPVSRKKLMTEKRELLDTMYK